jgi:hypothetical protein
MCVCAACWVRSVFFDPALAILRVLRHRTACYVLTGWCKGCWLLLTSRCKGCWGPCGLGCAVHGWVLGVFPGSACRVIAFPGPE